ncbi:MAG: TIM44-like domain-containing protein, partial [Christensenellaceae bacterium]|nr:TIM44-like domain-containing protein [Christensenellaceae bacterium]
MKKFLAILLVLMMLLPVAAYAVDFGGFSGDTDFGGSDWSSSSFDSFDYDYDYDDDYDYDSSYGGFGLGYGLGSLFRGVGSVVWIVIIAVVLIMISKKKKGGSSRPAGGNVTPQSMLRPMSEYAQLDPNFDGAEMAEKLANLYVQMQNAWTDKDISPVRPYFTDALYQQMERQVGMLAKTGRTNYVERIAVLGVTLRGFMQKNGEDHLIAELRTRIVDYTLDDATGRLISGSQTAEKFMTYEWELSRVSGAVTTKGENMRRVSCPGCGAPLDINATAKCPYCDSIVTLEEHDWAICSIKGISQTTK